MEGLPLRVSPSSLPLTSYLMDASGTQRTSCAERNPGAWIYDRGSPWATWSIYQSCSVLAPATGREPPRPSFGSRAELYTQVRQMASAGYCLVARIRNLGRIAGTNDVHDISISTTREICVRHKSTYSFVSGCRLTWENALMIPVLEFSTEGIARLHPGALEVVILPYAGWWSLPETIFDCQV